MSQVSKLSRVAHSRLVNLIFVIYWLLIFEGVLRKWVAPELKDYIFFVRVPVVLIVYAFAFHYRQWPRTTGIFRAAYTLAFIGAVMALVQFVTGGYDDIYLLLVVHGWMNYFFYIPLAFIIAEQFGRDEINRLIRQTLWIAVAAAPLVIMQYDAPASDVINQGYGSDVRYQFQNLGSGMDLVRPFGFFTSTLGQQSFVASCMALMLAVWFMPKRARPMGNTLLIAGTLSVLVMLILSQSRGLFFSVTLILLSAGVGASMSKKRRMLGQGILFVAVLILSVIVLWTMVFAVALEAFSERVLGAWEGETDYFQLGVLGRAFYSFYSFIYYLDDTPLIGYLMGIGSNAASQMAGVILPGVALSHTGVSAWGEEGWERHIIELGPILGLTYILFRIYLTWWLGITAMRAIKRTNNPTAILLFGFVGITLLVGQITGQGTLNGYTWMFVGFCAAAARVSDNRFEV